MKKFIKILLIVILVFLCVIVKLKINSKNVKKFKKRSIRIDGRLDVRIKTDYDEKRKAVIPAAEIKSMKSMENMESGKTVKRCIRY